MATLDTPPGDPGKTPEDPGSPGRVTTAAAAKSRVGHAEAAAGLVSFVSLLGAEGALRAGVVGHLRCVNAYVTAALVAPQAAKRGGGVAGVVSVVSVPLAREGSARPCADGSGGRG
eukprot:4817463-Pyramimonas_sp.AAC.2